MSNHLDILNKVNTLVSHMSMNTLKHKRELALRLGSMIQWEASHVSRLSLSTRQQPCEPSFSHVSPQGAAFRTAYEVEPLHSAQSLRDPKQ